MASGFLERHFHYNNGSNPVEEISALRIFRESNLAEARFNFLQNNDGTHRKYHTSLWVSGETLQLCVVYKKPYFSLQVT